MTRVPSWVKDYFGPTAIWLNGVLSEIVPRETINFVTEDGISLVLEDDVENNVTRFVFGFDAGELAIVLDGDVSGAFDACVVESITGVAGVVAIATTGATMRWAAATTSPTLTQADLATNGATGQALKIQAQNATGTTSTGGALNLSSGTGTSSAGAVNLQVGGTTRFEVTDTKTRWIGTRVRVHDIVSEGQTSSTSQTTTGTFTMADETLCTVDIIAVCARRTNVTKGGRYKRSVVYRRTGGTGPQIVGSLESGTDQETNAGDDVTIDVNGNDIRGRVTAADTDPRNWTVHMVVHEQLAT